MKRLVPELPKRITVPVNHSPYGIALRDQLFKNYRATIKQEKAHSELLETLTRHRKKS